MQTIQAIMKKGLWLTAKWRLVDRPLCAGLHWHFAPRFGLDGGHLNSSSQDQVSIGGWVPRPDPWLGALVQWVHHGDLRHTRFDQRRGPGPNDVDAPACALIG